MRDFLQTAKAVMLGHAIGDALGVPVEFKSRIELNKNPIKDMQGGGEYNMPKGTWSDDTSMSLCTLASLSRGKIGLKEIMENFGKWLYEGDFTATGTVFDVGGTCGNAINRHFKEKRSIHKCGLADEFSNGNGSLMRIHPIVLYLLYLNQDIKSHKSLKIIGAVSALTHAHPRSKLACGIYAIILSKIIEKPDKSSIKEGIDLVDEVYRHYSTGWDSLREEYNQLSHFKRLLDGIDKLDENEIYSEGYVVYSLEAALWCLLKTESFEECVLKAVNLGGDSDTTAAIAGGLAGALYGLDAIPQRWLDTLLKRDYIEKLCDDVFKPKQ